MAMLGLISGCNLFASMDLDAWRAYEGVEEGWIRDRYELVVQHAPAAVNAAKADLELKLADLSRRGMQFRHLLACSPAVLRGGVWQLTSLPVSESENAEMLSKLPEYRRQSEQLKQMTDALRSHPQYGILRKAQLRLWKTPHYREIHRKYMGRMQELQQVYGTAEPQIVPASN